MTAFAGFPRELFTFLEGLSEDNSKAHWNANKASWQAHLRGPMLALLYDLADEFGPLRLFRPNRDHLRGRLLLRVQRGIDRSLGIRLLFPAPLAL